jgi:hypothetical protein
VADRAGTSFRERAEPDAAVRQDKWLDELLDKSLDLGLKVCTLSHVVLWEAPGGGASCLAGPAVTPPCGPCVPTSLLAVIVVPLSRCPRHALVFP